MNNEQAHKQALEQADEQADEQATEQTSEHIIIKLNTFYNFINKEEAKFEGIHPTDRKDLINILKANDLYVYPESEAILQETNRLNEFKIYYWVIKEIYFSPYKGYIRKLKIEKIQMLYLQSIKYVMLRKKENYTLLDIMNYLIKSIELEAESVLNYAT